MVEFTITRPIDMPPEKAWEVFSAFTSLSIPSVSVDTEQEGDPAANGVGAIRRIDGKIRERLESMDPPNAYTYTVLSGVPIKDHLGRVEIKPQDGKALVNWSVRFNPKLPGTGWLIKNVYQKTLNKMIDELEASAG